MKGDVYGLGFLSTDERHGASVRSASSRQRNLMEPEQVKPRLDIVGLKGN